MCAAYKLFRVLSFACLIGATSTTFANDRYIGSWASSVDNPDGTGPLRPLVISCGTQHAQ